MDAATKGAVAVIDRSIPPINPMDPLAVGLRPGGGHGVVSRCRWHGAAEFWSRLELTRWGLSRAHVRVQLDLLLVRDRDQGVAAGGWPGRA
eukprot:2183629-Rhodomonas_salina.1